CRPQSAAVLAQLPARPGVAIKATEIQPATGLSPKAFWTTVGRLVDAGVVQQDSGRVQLDRASIDGRLSAWVADSPLHAIVERHPRLGPFVAWGRVVRMPSEPDLIEELYAGLASLFTPGEQLDEPQVNARIRCVHDDPA